MNSRLILHSIFIVALMSLTAATSAEGPSEDLMKNVIRIIGFHEQFLRDNGNKTYIAKTANEKDQLIKVLSRTTVKKALRSGGKNEEQAIKRIAKTPITHIIPIGAIPHESRRNKKPHPHAQENGKPVEHKETIGANPRAELKAAVKNAEFSKMMCELIAYMKKHYESTLYFYSEMERIKRDREIYDDLRKMVRYLEQPGKEFMKKAALQCYRTEVIQKQMTTNFWGNRTPNNLNINVLRDPINDGLSGP